MQFGSKLLIKTHESMAIAIHRLKCQPRQSDHYFGQEQRRQGGFHLAKIFLCTQRLFCCRVFYVIANMLRRNENIQQRYTGESLADEKHEVQSVLQSLMQCIV